MGNQNNLNGKVLNPIVDFNLIVNTELGLIRFIRENFQDANAFDLDRVNKSDREILSLLYSRINPNPLSIISTESNMGDIDDLYKSFFSNYKKEIIGRAVADVHIIKMVKMMFSSGISLGISGCVCVSDDLEKDQILSHFGRGNIINTKEKDSILAKDAFYIRDYTFFTKLGLEDKVIHKKFYMSPTNYNRKYFENVSNKLTATNQLVLIGKDYSSSEGDSTNERN